MMTLSPFLPVSPPAAILEPAQQGLALLGQTGGEMWFYPEAKSGFAPSVDFAFDVIFWISAFFFALIVAVMVAFVVLYRRRPGHVEQETAHHNTTLEVVWSVIPAILILAMFAAGVVGYINARQPPANPFEVNVIASQWAWSFVYDRVPGGVPELHVPPGRPIKLTMSSADVIHSFFVPEFRVKMDCVPGRFTYLWFEPTEPGRYRLYCAEYCGRDHSRMSTWVVVHNTVEDYEKWLDDASNLYRGADSLAEVGEKIWRMQGCMACHSVDGSAIAGGGPTWKGSWGTTQQTDKGPVVVDLEYMRESIEYPQAKIRRGYEGGNMPSYLGRFQPIDYYAIASFMRKLTEGDTFEQTPEEQRLLEEARGGDVPAGDGSQDTGGGAIPPVEASGGRGAALDQDESNRPPTVEPARTEAIPSAAQSSETAPAETAPAATAPADTAPADATPPGLPAEGTTPDAASPATEPAPAEPTTTTP